MRLLQFLHSACHRLPFTVNSLYPNFITRGPVTPVGPVTVTDALFPDSNVPLAQWWPDFEFPQRATTWATTPFRHGARSSILYWPDVSATALGQHSSPVQARHRFPRLISGPLALGCRTPCG